MDSFDLERVVGALGTVFANNKMRDRHTFVIEDAEENVWGKVAKKDTRSASSGSSSYQETGLEVWSPYLGRKQGGRPGQELLKGADA